jgi:hypothetical protein
MPERPVPSVTRLLAELHAYRVASKAAAVIDAVRALVQVRPDRFPPALWAASLRSIGIAARAPAG